VETAHAPRTTRATGKRIIGFGLQLMQNRLSGAMERHTKEAECKFDQATQEQILGLAARLQADAHDKISAKQLEDIGLEVGIEPAYVQEAIHLLQFGDGQPASALALSEEMGTVPYGKHEGSALQLGAGFLTVLIPIIWAAYCRNFAPMPLDPRLHLIPFGTVAAGIAVGLLTGGSKRRSLLALATCLPIFLCFNWLEFLFDQECLFILLAGGIAAFRWRRCTVKASVRELLSLLPKPKQMINRRLDPGSASQKPNYKG